MNHPVQIAGWTPDEIGRRLAGLRYDALAEVLRSLSNTLVADSVADNAAGRVQLGGHLFQLSEYVGLASARASRAWIIASKHGVHP